MNSIIDVLSPNNCCGCGACINSCPTGALSYSVNEYGFYRPQIDKFKCVSCGKCCQVCPQCNDLTINKPFSVYAAINKDFAVLKRSASGGIFYALAESVIVEGGCVFGASLDTDFKVRHRCVEKLDDLHLLQKSKYVQSYIGESYKVALCKLKKGQKVLFSGTPCQVAAMKSVAGKHNKNLILVEVVCHGIPSQKMFDDYLKNLEKKMGPLEEYVFCYKRKLLNGMNKYLFYRTKNAKRKINWPQDSYHAFFMGAEDYQECCYTCKFARAERVADLTLCDYWNWETFHKNDFPVGSTLSGVCVNTMQGKVVLENVASKLKVVGSSFEMLSLHNGCLLKPSHRPLSRDDIMDDWISKGYVFLENQYKKKNRYRILKSFFLMYVPEKLKLWIHGLRHGN